MSFLPSARLKFLKCFFIHLSLSSLLVLNIPLLEAKDFPERIYVLVAERLPDGAGDIALNIRSAQMLQDGLNFTGAEVILLVPASSQSTVDQLLDKNSKLKQISLKDNPHLEVADFLFSFSQHQELSALPKNVLNAANHHFIYKDHAENGFYIHHRKPEAPLTLKQLESELLSIGILEAQGLHLGRIAVAYTFNKIPSEAYMWAVARYASEKPHQRFFLLTKSSFELNDFSAKLPPNLTLISHPTLPLNMHESAIAHSDLPVLVTGLGTINIALDHQKPLFYELRMHAHLTWKNIVSALTPTISNEELEYDLKKRAFNSEGVRTYITGGTESVIQTTEHANLVDYFYDGLGNERINRLFHTPQTLIREKHSLPIRWLRHIRNTYSFESNPRFERVRSQNQGILEILALRGSHSESLAAFLENSLHPALVNNSILLPGLVEEFITSIELTRSKKIEYPYFFVSDLIEHLQKIILLSKKPHQGSTESLIKWKQLFFQLILKEQGETLLIKLIPLWKAHQEIRPNNRMLEELLQTKARSKIQAYKTWLKKEDLELKLQGKSRFAQAILKCKAWLIR